MKNLTTDLLLPIAVFAVFAIGAVLTTMFLVFFIEAVTIKPTKSLVDILSYFFAFCVLAIGFFFLVKYLFNLWVTKTQNITLGIIVFVVLTILVIIPNILLYFNQKK